MLLTTTHHVWHALSDALRRYILVRTRDEALTDDVLQDTFLRIHRGLATLQDDQALRPWVWRVTRSALIDALRRERPGEQLPDDLEADDTVMLSATEQVASWMPQFVAALPEPYRTAVQLSELEGLSQAEVARQLGISPSGARSRVQRGRLKVKELLDDCCKVRFAEGEVVDVRPRDRCGCA